MATLTFDFDEKRLADDGKTAEEMLAPMRAHAKKYGIEEVARGVFQKDGEDAMCEIGMFVVRYSKKHPEYISFMNTWMFDVEGDVEDCVVEMRDIFMEEGIEIPRV